MASKHDTDFDPTRPALVLLYGNTSKKHRMLDRDVITIGRARGCDFGLDAPDISSIHCVITRGPAGFKVRDCQSRAGTKHNGNLIRETPLRDGDLLQIGPFSFRAHLPAGCVVSPGTPVTGRLAHLERSRRNLARLAMRQRKTLKLQRIIKNGNGKDTVDQLNKQAVALKAKIRDYDKRVRTLEDAELDLHSERESLDRQMAGFRADMLRGEQEMALRRKQCEEEIQACWDHYRQQSQQAPQQTSQVSPVSQAAQDDLTRREQVLARQLQEFHQLQQELLMKRDQWAQDQAPILARLGEHKMALTLAEETLREQRQALEKFMTSVEQGNVGGAAADPAELQELRGENEELRQRLAQREEVTHSANGQVLQLRQDNQRLKEQVTTLEREQQKAPQTVVVPDPATKEELALLRKLLEEKDALLAEMHERPPQASEAGRDEETFEAEMNAFRRQLEGDRQKLDREFEQLRARHKELDDATREWELELSRERAELGRERQRLERLRDDVRQDVERMQRDSGMRGRLASVQNLREEINLRRNQ